VRRREFIFSFPATFLFRRFAQRITALVELIQKVSTNSSPRLEEEVEEEEEEEEFFNHYKNDLKRHAHTPREV